MRGTVNIDSRRIAAAAAIAFLVYAVFLNSLSNGFVYDDNILILYNPWVKEGGHFLDMFTNHTFGFSKEPYAAISYRPMIFVVYRALYALFNENPLPYHLLNVTLHAVNSVLVFLLASMVFHGRGGVGAAGWVGGDRKGGSTGGFFTDIAPPFFAAAVFAAHPLNSESAAWISTTAELSFTLLCLTAFFLYLGSLEVEEDSPSGFLSLFTLKYRLLPAFLYFTAILFKETAVFLPFLIFVHDIFRGNKEGLFSSSRIKRYLFFALAAVAYIAVRLSIIKGMGPSMKLHAYLTPFQYFLNAAALFGKDMRMLVLPLYDYPLQLLDPVYSVSDLRALLPLLFSAGAAVLAFIYRRRIDPLYFLAASIVILPILPSLYSVAVSRHPYADRYLYFPSIGYAMAISLLYRGAATRAVLKNRKAPLYAATALLSSMTVAFAFWAASRNGIWKDDLTLRLTALKGSPDNYVMLHDLGGIYLRTGDPEEGFSLLEKALRLNLASAHPDPTMAVLTHKVLADNYAKRGRADEAIRHYNEALKLEPENIVSNYNLATLYREKGLYDDAIELYSTARVLADEPWELKDIYHGLGDSYAGKGRWDKALLYYDEALRVSPGDPEIALKREDALRRAGGGRGR